MRKRTAEQINACPHDAPRQQVATMTELGLRGDFGWKIMGCPKCGGIARELVFHLNYGKTQPDKAGRQRQNDEEWQRVQTEMRAWRDALPEPD